MDAALFAVLGCLFDDPWWYISAVLVTEVVLIFVGDEDDAVFVVTDVLIDEGILFF